MITFVSAILFFALLGALWGVFSFLRHNARAKPRR